MQSYQRPPRKPEAIGGVVRRLLHKSGLDRRLAHLDIEMAWADAARDLAVGDSRVEHFRKGVLTISVVSLPKKYELESFCGDAIIKRINLALKRDRVRALNFKVGNLSEQSGRQAANGRVGGIEEAGEP